jgi:hypothetical protein
MAGGGQKGVGGIEFAGGAMILLGFIGGCTARGWYDGGGSNDDAGSSFDTQCEQAYFDERAGEDFNAVVLADPLCKEHMRIELQVRGYEQQQDLQEAKTP